MVLDRILNWYKQARKYGKIGNFHFAEPYSKLVVLSVHLDQQGVLSSTMNSKELAALLFLEFAHLKGENITFEPEICSAPHKISLKKDLLPLFKEWENVYRRLSVKAESGLTVTRLPIATFKGLSSLELLLLSYLDKESTVNKLQKTIHIDEDILELCLFVLTQKRLIKITRQRRSVREVTSP